MDGLVSREEVPQLKCSQEDADTRMLLHAAHAASQGFASIVLRSPDTDVAVIAISLAGKVPAQLVFRTGTQHRVRFIDLTQLALHHGATSASLIGLHSFTGCDSCSSFSGIGKKKGFY